jgi:hypothetical protein
LKPGSKTVTRFAAIEICLLAGWLSVLSCPAVRGADGEWGDLTLRVTYGGTPPKPKTIAFTSDIAVCGVGKLDESLVVNAKDLGIANVALWLVPEKGEVVPEHPSLTPSGDGVSLAIKECRFEPYFLLMRPQTLTIRNADPIGFVPKVEFFGKNNRPPSNVIPARGEISVVIADEEAAPVRVDCAIHPWMRSWLLIRATPYMAVSDASGKFSIKNLPVGKRKFRLWHERTGYIPYGTLDGSAVEWKRGPIEWEIKPGANDLGELKLKPEVFK